MIRGILFAMRALVYGPTGPELLSAILRDEGIAAEPHEVAEAAERLPAALRDARSVMRTEEQENDYHRAMLPVLLANLGVPSPTDALLLRLLEQVHQYSAYWSMYPETLPVLAELQRSGYRLAVAANWAPSLPRFLREFELDGYFAAAVASGSLGVDKPDPSLFRRTLEAAGLHADEALHVGPGLTEDVSGALAAGIRPVWLNRTGIPTDHEVLTVTDLRGLLLVTGKAGA